MKTIHAVYEGGVFRPLEKVELPERSEVEFEPRPVTHPQGDDDGLDNIYAIMGERYQSGERNVAAAIMSISHDSVFGHGRSAGRLG